MYTKHAAIKAEGVGSCLLVNQEVTCGALNASLLDQVKQMSDEALQELRDVVVNMVLTRASERARCVALERDMQSAAYQSNFACKVGSRVKLYFLGRLTVEAIRSSNDGYNFKTTFEEGDTLASTILSMHHDSWSFDAGDNIVFWLDPSTVGNNQVRIELVA